MSPRDAFFVFNLPNPYKWILEKQYILLIINKIKIPLSGRIFTKPLKMINYYTTLGICFLATFSINGSRCQESKQEIKTVQIASQVWTTNNLDVSTYRNGDPIPEVKDPKEWNNLATGAWCYYNLP